MGYHSERISLFMMKLFSLAAFLFAAFLTFLAFHNKNVLLFMIAALPVGVIATCLCVRYFLPGIAEGFSEFLIMPRHFLDKAPMILSSYYGDLANGSYQKVFDELQAFPARAFRDPEVVFLYAQACMNIRGYEMEGLAKMETFFQSSARKNNKNNMQLLMYYADCARKRRPVSAVIRLLEKEAKLRCYNENERRAVLIRCAALRKDVRS